MWYISSIQTFYHIAGQEYSCDIPCVNYCKEFRQRFGDIQLTVRELGTNGVVTLRGHGHWRDIDAVLESYLPYGYLRHTVDEDMFLDCTLVAVDELSYRFLEYVDGFSKVWQVESRTRMKDFPAVLNGIATLTFYSLDSDRTLLGRCVAGSVHGGFPLMHVVLGVGDNWLADGNYYLRFKEARDSIYRIDFCNKAKARNMLSKVSAVYGTNKMRSGSDMLKSLALW